MKGALPVTILQSLWQAVSTFVKIHDLSLSFSEVFYQAGLEYLQKPTPLPIRPHRRVTKYGMANAYKQQFPTVRTSIWIDPLFLEKLITKLNEYSQSQFEVDLDLRSAVETVLFAFCKAHGISVEDSYFDDDYFYRTYTYGDREQTLDAIRVLVGQLGRVPTAREWANERQKVNGPSMKRIQMEFGSFSEAIREAMSEGKKY